LKSEYTYMCILFADGTDSARYPHVPKCSITGQVSASPPLF